MATDPVCRTPVDEEKVLFKTQYGGQTYFFCSLDCVEEFENDPERFQLAA
jgi:YHS domain-containing protein